MRSPQAKAHHADPLRVEIGTRLQVIHRRAHVEIFIAAEGQPVAAALAVDAQVNHQYAISVIGEHQRVIHRPQTVGRHRVNENHRGPILGGEVPAANRHAVLRRDFDIFVGEFFIGGSLAAQRHTLWLGKSFCHEV
jgi:hypothetical protein